MMTAARNIALFALLLTAPSCHADRSEESALSEAREARSTMVTDAEIESTEPAAEQNARLRIALTFDDVPLVLRRFRRACDGEAVVALNRDLLDVIREQEIPATGLVVGSRACGSDPDAVLKRVLEDWLDAGHSLGNHTYTHRDLNAVTLEWYLDDIKRGETELEALLDQHGQKRRWFRPPLLHAGDTPEKRNGLERFLLENGYSTAVVTVDNQEWVFAVVYENAKEAGDIELAARVGSGFIAHIEENLAYYEELSDRVFGRRIPQVLLLHANLLNIDYLDELATMLRDRGYELISLDEAARDPAYQSADEYVGPRGLSWLQRWALAKGIEPDPEPREPEWIARLMQEVR